MDQWAKDQMAKVMAMTKRELEDELFILQPSDDTISRIEILGPSTVGMFEWSPTMDIEYPSLDLGSVGPMATTMFSDDNVTALIEIRMPEGMHAPFEFRVAPMDDPLTHFKHDVWYRVEVVDGKPTIREVPE